MDRTMQPYKEVQIWTVPCNHTRRFKYGPNNATLQGGLNMDRTMQPYKVKEVPIWTEQCNHTRRFKYGPNHATLQIGTHINFFISAILEESGRFSCMI